ncbi:MAG TPA: hypothetical protein VKP65_19715 [Rhodothermales bacterium]|nr:hypothetical protein [Rhodothermales bacterium]
MARFLVFLVVVGTTSLVMYNTKPTEVDYLDLLHRRATVVAPVEGDAFLRVHSEDPIDEMVATQSPMILYEQTRVDDYYLATIFTTEYRPPGYPVRRVRTYGFASKLISFRDY